MRNKTFHQLLAVGHHARDVVWLSDRRPESLCPTLQAVTHHPSPITRRPSPVAHPYLLQTRTRRNPTLPPNTTSSCVLPNLNTNTNHDSMATSKPAPPTTMPSPVKKQVKQLKTTVKTSVFGENKEV